jgi:hypothetical protein
MVVVDDVDVIKQRINQLQEEHHDLDDVIGKLAVDPSQDELQVKRLKKRKLQLKDLILALQNRLRENVPA